MVVGVRDAEIAKEGGGERASEAVGLEDKKYIYW